ncbi:MAG: hypothetical protein APF84_11355 [Gracilibacter sp. BRH_c7a]|nr:MAG: hypothetical protein APF84_11355 [Gracilibacter sp. BRH_c7a]
MYYSKEELEQIRKKSEEYLQKEEENSKGKKYTSAAELEVNCTHCGYDRFEQGKALLNTRGMSFFDLDWLNADATTLICIRCGYIQWFGKNVTEITE